MSANVLNDHRLAHRAPLPRGMAADPRMLGGPLDRNHSPVGMTAHSPWLQETLQHKTLRLIREVRICATESPLCTTHQ